MIGSDFSEEVDCGSFFDQFDDLIEFPADNECGLGSGSCNTDFPSIWPDSGSIFSGNSSSSSAADLSAELSVPYEDIVQLEWLSNFVEDSFSGGGMTLVKENPPIVDKDLSSRSHFQTSSPVSVLDSSSGNGSSSSSSSSSGEKTITPLSPTRHGPQRARSKRPRPASFIPRPAIQLISPTSSESEHFVESHPTNEIPKKKKKVKTSPPNLVPVETNRNQPSQAVRKCLHCEITKTPQWRAGPLGPKTLCNACGVRFKSGRLFPEYRPAASPTFVASLHSNSHKKVVEMRSNGGSEKSPAVMATKPELIPNRNPLMGVSFE